MADDHIIEVHTSDRGLWKRCRRKFGWASTMRENLVRIGPDQKAFFLGTGFHFALEDFWGYRRFDHPAMAFAAYYDAQNPDDLPDDAEEALDLAVGMLSYYVEEWLDEHPEPYETLTIAGVPQVEVEVAIELNGLLDEYHLDHADEFSPKFNGYLADFLRENIVIYVTTFDRVVIDRHERIWGMDYKTAGNFDELNLQTNPQSGAYNWSMNLFYKQYGHTPEGIIWQQHVKRVPHPPKLVAVGKKDEGFSLDIRQSTTYRIYKRTVKQHYDGEVPQRYLSILAELANVQDDNGDKFVRRDNLRLNDAQRRAEQEKIVQETLEMLNPDLPLYPNPTKDCSYDCPFKAPCLALDDGSDYEHLLDNEYEAYKGYKDTWRKKIKWPKEAA